MKKVEPGSDKFTFWSVIDHMTRQEKIKDKAAQRQEGRE